jgi:hypothetical protein
VKIKEKKEAFPDGKSILVHLENYLEQKTTNKKNI